MKPLRGSKVFTSSVEEEAKDTRNDVYNLQWPTNSGRLLVAEFVDSQDVKIGVEAPPQSPATRASVISIPATPHAVTF